MALMTRAQLLAALPPCGLVCHTCPAYDRGVIRAHAEALLRLSAGTCDFLDARLPAEHREELAEQAAFEAALARRAQAGCPGCRNLDGQGPNCIPGCIIPGCCLAHGVDFCGECAKFPCGRPEASGVYHAAALAGFLDGGAFIRAHGPQAYFERVKDVSHYFRYQKFAPENGAGTE